MTVGAVKEVYRASSLLKFGNVVDMCSEYLLNSLNTSNCIGEKSYLLWTGSSKVDPYDWYDRSC